MIGRESAHSTESLGTEIRNRPACGPVTIRQMQRFEEHDSEEILRRALAIDAQHQGSDREAMLAAARELGISDEALVLAEEQWTKEKEDREHFREFVRQQRSGWMGHLVSYLVFLAFFFFLDVRDGNLTWFWWPTIGWGIGVFFHSLGVLNTKSQTFQDEFRKWRQNRSIES